MADNNDAKIVKGLVPGTTNDTSVLGDVAEARNIADRSLDVVRRFSEAIIKQDIETAYALCANELRCSFGIKRFVTDLHTADEEYSGKPISYTPQRITWIYADEASRKESNKEGGWPKNTPKPNKRALVGGWWTAQKTSEGEFGRSVFFGSPRRPRATELPSSSSITNDRQAHLSRSTRRLRGVTYSASVGPARVRACRWAATSWTARCSQLTL
jgi:hypothetical protein